MVQYSIWKLLYSSLYHCGTALGVVFVLPFIRFIYFLSLDDAVTVQESYGPGVIRSASPTVPNPNPIPNLNPILTLTLGP